jgi:transposase
MARRLSSGAKQQIVKLVAYGVTRSHAADRFGVTYQTVYGIVKSAALRASQQKTAEAKLGKDADA